MQRNFLGFVLLGLAIISALVTAYLCLQTSNAMAGNKRANAKIVELQRKIAATDGLVSEALEYSKKNPAILQALRSAGITNMPASNQPRR